MMPIAARANPLARSSSSPIVGSRVSALRSNFGVEKMVSLFKEQPSPTVPHSCIPSLLTNNSLSYACIGAYASASAHCSVSACTWRERLALPSRLTALPPCAELLPLGLVRALAVRVAVHRHVATTHATATARAGGKLWPTERKRNQKIKTKISLRLVRASHDLGLFLVPKSGSEKPARAGSRKPLLRFIFVLKTWFQNFIRSWFRFGTQIWGQFWIQNLVPFLLSEMRPHTVFLQLNITSRHQAW